MRINIFKTLFSLALLSTFINEQVQAQQAIFPKITGHIGIVHPIITFNSAGSHTNFKDSYIVGIPIGINIWKSSKIGFSSEIVPFIKATAHGSEVNNILFHPGVLVALGHGFTFAGRAAFETSGRYGLTPVINKMVKKNSSSSYFIAIPLPLRFGNDLPSSFSIGFQFGVTF